MGYTNFHTHTPRCKHARGTEEEYIRAAVESGYEELGFSDHSPWPFADGHISGVRMDVRELSDYVRTLSALREAYRDKLRLYIGLECEAYEEFYPWIREQKETYGLDYLILGNHTVDVTEEHFYFHGADREMLLRYTDDVIRAMRTGLFRIFAHPELIFSQIEDFDDTAASCARAMCECAKETGVLLEYNLQGDYYREKGRFTGLGYPNLPFIEIAGSLGCSAIVGVDAHFPEMLTWTDKLENAQRLLAEHGLCVKTSPLDC